MERHHQNRRSGIVIPHEIAQNYKEWDDCEGCYDNKNHIKKILQESRIKGNQC